MKCQILFSEENKENVINLSSVELAQLSFTTLWAYSADNKLVFFFSNFFQKIGFDISCK